MTTTSLPLTLIGNPILRTVLKKAAEHDLHKPELKLLIEQMVKTMHEASGVGLAANQVNVNRQLIVLECKSDNPRYPDRLDVPLQVYFNPVITQYSEEQIEDWEGCLSIPGYRGLVPRAKLIHFEALNDRGQKIIKTVDGFEARILQHEVDHLNGIFYIDRMPTMKSYCSLQEFNRQHS